MALYSVLDPEYIKRKPVYALIVAAFFVGFGFVSAFFIFPAEFSISIISFSSLFLLPFVLQILETERLKKGVSKERIKGIFSRHHGTTVFFIFIFFGMSIEYMLLFGFVHPAIGNVAFEQQLGLVFRSPAGYFSSTDVFWEIVANNIRLVFISILLSMVYGIGSIFILNYNASIVGMIYGSSIRRVVWSSYYPVFPNPLWYLPHIILEILAYLFASIAGAIIYKSIKLGERSYSSFFRDAGVFIAISIALIFIAGYIEVTVPFIPRG